MQFYRDGFYTGDPATAPSSALPRPSQDVDVLVVGTGPAGLVLAAQLARFPSIRTAVVERREGPLELGQADGVACRSMEMFEAFGIAGRILEESYQVNETRFWGPDPERPAVIARTGRVQDVEDGLSEMPHLILNQARVHDHLLQAMRSAPTRLAPDYGLELVDLVVPDHDGPVEATVRDVRTGAARRLRATYVVGCDGARSRVRRLVGRRLDGDRADHAWGVLDVLAVTDFPDIRFKSAIRSAEHGSILLIPREGGYLVRLYVDLGDVRAADRERVRSMSAEEVVERARRVLHPYSLEVRETVWFSVYEVAQRIADRFDDGADAGEDPRPPRVFIAGDACHTHSAKAGQGMNVSMQDAFNLGWKLASVIEGRSAATLLQTYDAERRPVAQQLIDFDKEWSTMLAGSPTREAPGPDGRSRDDLLATYFTQQGRYTAGVATRYPAGALVGGGEHQHLATGFEVGTRFHSAPVTRLADARRVHLGHAARADGRWRLYLFADHARLAWDAALTWLAEDPASPVVRHRRADDDVDAVLDVRGVLPCSSHEVELADLPALLRPGTGALGLVDLEKCFTATTTPAAAAGGEVDVFDLRGVDRDEGAMVLVRPDQHVAQVLPLTGTRELSAFLAGVLLDAGAQEPLTRR